MVVELPVPYSRYEDLWKVEPRPAAENTGIAVAAGPCAAVTRVACVAVVQTIPVQCAHIAMNVIKAPGSGQKLSTETFRLRYVLFNQPRP